MVRGNACMTVYKYVLLYITEHIYTCIIICEVTQSLCTCVRVCKCMSMCMLLCICLCNGTWTCRGVQRCIYIYIFYEWSFALGA